MPSISSSRHRSPKRCSSASGTAIDRVCQVSSRIVATLLETRIFSAPVPGQREMLREVIRAVDRDVAREVEILAVSFHPAVEMVFASHRINFGFVRIWTGPDSWRLAAFRHRRVRMEVGFRAWEASAICSRRVGRDALRARRRVRAMVAVPGTLRRHADSRLSQPDGRPACGSLFAVLGKARAACICHTRPRSTPTARHLMRNSSSRASWSMTRTRQRSFTLRS